MRGARRPPRWLSAARERGSTQGLWLARALGKGGVMPFPLAEQAIRAGRVTVGGRTVTEPFAPVDPHDEVRVDGDAVRLDLTTRVLALHKPAGVVTHAFDREGRGTVFEVLLAAVPPQLARFGWHAVGRLDRDTTGLLLFTNDERVVEHVTSPATHLPKRYVATVASGVTDEALERLAAGLRLDDGPTRPALARRRSERVVELTITEGRNHQVKRMLGAVGLATLALHREAIGAVELDVAVGTARALLEREVREGLGFSPPSAAAPSPPRR